MATHPTAQSRAGQQKLLYEKVPSEIERHLGPTLAAGTFLELAISGGLKFWWLIPIIFVLGILTNLSDSNRKTVRFPNRLFDCGDAILVEYIAARISERLPFSPYRRNRLRIFAADSV
jgi:hypothetical protein